MSLVMEAAEERLGALHLVRAAQRGEREAYGQLIERYRNLVYSIAMRRLGNDAEAEELAQEVFVQVLRKLDQLREPEAFCGWLRAITVRMAINRRTRRREAIGTEPEALEAACIERRTPVDEALKGETASQVRDGLDRLGDLDRETLEAFYVRGRSLIEMSDEFSSPIGTIKRRLHVARKRLARELHALAPM